MQRQRGELVPVGEVIADLDGPVKAIREASPPARRGFTLADQVNRLVTARESDPDLGFQARMMALCSLPRTNPGNRLQYKRTNGPYTLGMECRNRQQTSLRQLGPLADGVDFDRGGQDAVARVGVGTLIDRVHEQARHQQRKRGQERRTDAAPQPDGSVVQLDRPVHLRA